MRSKKALLSFITTLIFQIVSAVCGLIVPQLFISHYGSEVNGLVSSINQFLNYITFFEAGLSGVIMAQLYRPIAENNIREINGILGNAHNFFNKIALSYVLYVVVLTVAYPNIVNVSFSTRYVSALILILSISLLFQYLFGIVNNIYLQANQQAYIISIVQTVVVLLNAIITFLCIQLSMSIHALKAFTVLAAIINPLALWAYVKLKHREIKPIKGNSKNIKQRWDALCHHICYFVQNNIDIMLLTFLDLKLVSVYYVYHMITQMIRRVFDTFMSAYRSVFGDLFARKEYHHLQKVFSNLEFLVYTLAAILFTSLSYAIIPFVELYTENVNDVNYIQPLFAGILIFAELFYIIRVPYHIYVNATGRFKETRNASIIEALLNVVISSITLYSFGLVGVALGTCISCLYRTIYYVFYLSNTELELSRTKVLKRCLVNAGSAIICIAIFNALSLKSQDYISWFFNGVCYFIISTIIILSSNIIFFKDDAMFFKDKLITTILKKRLS